MIPIISEPKTDPSKKIFRIIVKAFKGEGIKKEDDIINVVEWAIGKDYANVPYHFWGQRIYNNHPEISNMPALEFSAIPISLIMRAVARLYCRKKILH